MRVGAPRWLQSLVEHFPLDHLQLLAEILRSHLPSNSRFFHFLLKLPSPGLTSPFPLFQRDLEGKSVEPLVTKPACRSPCKNLDGKHRRREPPPCSFPARAREATACSPCSSSSNKLLQAHLLQQDELPRRASRSPKLPKPFSSPCVARKR